MLLRADIMCDVGRVGAAKRRRGQLRAFHRHVQQTVRKELATALHHSSQRRKSRVVEGPREEEADEKYGAPRREKRPPPRMRPVCMAEPHGPQERIRRHTMEQMAEFAPLVQILDAPVDKVSQLAEQLVDVLVLPVVRLASGRDAAGTLWYQIAGRRGSTGGWWAEPHQVVPPEDSPR